MKIISWSLRIVAAIIMLQTLYFKFTAQPESVNLFTILGMEPWGRIGTGIMELIASTLLLIPRTKLLGAFLGIVLMSGAIFFHLAKVGIIDPSGSPLLFVYASTIFLCCAILLALHFEELKQILTRSQK